MKECYLYKKLENDKVQCQTCAHQCLISAGQRGICGVRKNKDGKLYLLVYGQAITCHIDPIEKKPLYHFMPGSWTLSIATVGCNFRCDNCQNWQISQAPKGKISNDEIQKMGDNLSPAEIIELTIKNKCPSISYTYTEPTIYLEYALDTMKLAKEKGLKNIWVSNGFMSLETLEMIAPYLDAINIDLKSFDNDFYQKVCGAKLEPVLENLKKIKELGIWLEVTTLIIPTLSDNEKNLRQIAEFIKSELGEETPWHVSAFSPEISWKLKDLPAASYKQVETAYKIGQEVGLKHVHMGNI